MIYIANNKITVDGVDVYPDHKNKNQFWYIPGNIHLAEHNGKKKLSYICYTDSGTDNAGTGFLNFEVNTALNSSTLSRIKNDINKKYKISVGEINLARVPYTKGNVNLSVLDSIVQKGDSSNLKNDPSVLRVNNKQLVWSVGSSSLVGDNSAACSVEFTKEGKLAGAMKQSILNGSNAISAVYNLAFLAMRPSITFTVEGTLEKTIKDFQASIGTQISLEAFILDGGIQGRWQKIMKKTDLKITVEDFTGEETEGLKWAQQIILDYVLKNFFEVDINNRGNWSPLSEAPKVVAAVKWAKNIEEVARARKKTKDEDAVQLAVNAAVEVIPKVNIRAAYYDGRQENTINTMYSEKKAASYSAIPQSLILGGLSNPEEYILQVNRAQDPSGLPYPVQVSVPNSEAQKKLGLQTINIQGKYLASADPSKQATFNHSVVGSKIDGNISFPFQKDKFGSNDVAYSIEYVFDSRSEWAAEKSQYTDKGVSNSGMIVAMPESIVDFYTLNLHLSTDFIWDEVDQAIVTLTSKKWAGKKTVVFNRGDESSKMLKFRYNRALKDSPINYQVNLMSNNNVIANTDSIEVKGNHITIQDRFTEHIPITFKSHCKDSVSFYCSYEDGDFYWEEEFPLEPKESKKIIAPTLKKFVNKKDFKLNYEVTNNNGNIIMKGKAQTGKSIIIES